MLNLIENLIGQGILKLLDSTKQTQKAQVTGFDGELLDDVDRVENYGFTSNPLPGALATFVSVGGDRSHTIILSVEDRRYRVVLEKGEVCIYTDEGDRIHFKRNREIHFTCGTKVVMDTPRVEITGDLLVAGDITDNSGSNDSTVKDLRDTYNSHTHPGDSGGTTGAPNQSVG